MEMYRSYFFILAIVFVVVLFVWIFVTNQEMNKKVSLVFDSVLVAVVSLAIISTVFLMKNDNDDLKGDNVEVEEDQNNEQKDEGDGRIRGVKAEEPKTPTVTPIEYRSGESPVQGSETTEATSEEKNIDSAEDSEESTSGTKDVGAESTEEGAPKGGVTNDSESKSTDGEGEPTGEAEPTETEQCTE